MTVRAEIPLALGPVLAMAAASDHVLYVTGSDVDGCFSCFLYRVTLDPDSTTATEILPIGPVQVSGSRIDDIVGMTFGSDGTLYAISELTDGLYTVDTVSGESTLLGTVDLDLLGGDITFDAQDTLWLWTNGAPGLYILDPQTAHATLFQPQPSIRIAGLAALGHGDVIYGSSPADDSLNEILPASGFTDGNVLLRSDGFQFDHKRGDLDSPYCPDAAACDDLDACTSDTCTPGGCRNIRTQDCCTSDAACSDGDPCTADSCDPTNRCVHAPATGPACDDGDACTTGDTCSAGVCGGVPRTMPSEVGIVLVEGTGPSHLSWAAQEIGVAYDVAAGSLQRLRSDGGVGAAACLATDVSETAYVDARPVPPPGDGDYYLVRGRISACGTGTYGFASSGAERLPSVPCP